MVCVRGMVQQIVIVRYQCVRSSSGTTDSTCILCIYTPVGAISTVVLFTMRSSAVVPRYVLHLQVLVLLAVRYVLFAVRTYS